MQRDLANPGAHDDAWQPTAGDRVLLINPPVVDTRFPWARWHQPSLLLRLAAEAAARGVDVNLVDAFEIPRGKRVRKQKVQRFVLDGQPVDQWRFGRAENDLERELVALRRAGWLPRQTRRRST